MTSKNRIDPDDFESEEEFLAWLNDPNLEPIDWSKIEIKGEPYEGPPVDGSEYADIVKRHIDPDTEPYINSESAKKTREEAAAANERDRLLDQGSPSQNKKV